MFEPLENLTNATANGQKYETFKVSNGDVHFSWNTLFCWKSALLGIFYWEVGLFR
jgi:hypothetical protein